jgi:peptidoglycan/xylan/chitin deacetylase (PgdA/CDA1 family)
MKITAKIALAVFLLLVAGMFIFFQENRLPGVRKEGCSKSVATPEKKTPESKSPAEAGVANAQKTDAREDKKIKNTDASLPVEGEAAEPWIKILNYHEIFPESVKKSKDPAVNRFSKPSDLLLIVTTEEFEKQMEYLSKTFKCVKMSDYGRQLEKNEPFKENVVIITFDGADKTIYSQAYPILKKYNLPATLFLHINSLLLDKTAMKWDTIIRLHEEGLMEIESHSVSHPHLNRKLKNESAESYETRIRKELADSKRIIEEKLNKKVYYFAYPYGGYNSTVIRLLKETGYKASVTVQWDKNTIKTNPYALRRRGVLGVHNMKNFIELFKQNIKDDLREYAD